MSHGLLRGCFPADTVGLVDNEVVGMADATGLVVKDEPVPTPVDATGLVVVLAGLVVLVEDDPVPAPTPVVATGLGVVATGLVAG